MVVSVGRTCTENLTSEWFEEWFSCNIVADLSEYSDAVMSRIPLWRIVGKPPMWQIIAWSTVKRAPQLQV